MKAMTYLKNVTTLSLDQEKCKNCGTCLEVCPHGVLVMNSGRVAIHDRDACMECGACSRNCPFDAVSVQAGVGCAAAVIGSLLDPEAGVCCGPECKGSVEAKKCC